MCRRSPYRNSLLYNSDTYKETPKHMQLSLPLVPAWLPALVWVPPAIYRISDASRSTWVCIFLVINTPMEADVRVHSTSPSRSYTHRCAQPHAVSLYPVQWEGPLDHPLQPGQPAYLFPGSLCGCHALLHSLSPRGWPRGSPAGIWAAEKWMARLGLGTPAAGEDCL